MVLSLVGFAAAFVAFGDAARRGCVAEAPEDPSYRAAFDGPVTVDDAVHTLEVSHAGKPVAGAWVCVNAEMVGRPALSAVGEGRELARGRYEVPLHFPAPGRWRARVLLAEDDGAAPTAAIGLSFDVGAAAEEQPAVTSPR